MFGKPEWFAGDTGRLLPSPGSVSGWSYYAIWALVIGLPAILLASRHQLPELAVWMVAASSALLLDTRWIRREIGRRVARSRLHYIDDVADAAAVKP